MTGKNYKIAVVNNCYTHNNCNKHAQLTIDRRRYFERITNTNINTQR